MSQILKMSEAAAIGIHAMVLIGGSDGGPISTKIISCEFDVSENHCSKVMQRLTKTGLVNAIRGPKGGFILKRPASEISVLEIYEAIDGPLENVHCFFNKTGCSPCCLLFGSFMEEANALVKKHFGPATLQSVINNRNKSRI